MSYKDKKKISRLPNEVKVLLDKLNISYKIKKYKPFSIGYYIDIEISNSILNFNKEYFDLTIILNDNIIYNDIEQKLIKETDNIIEQINLLLSKRP